MAKKVAKGSAFRVGRKVARVPDLRVYRLNRSDGVYRCAECSAPRGGEHAEGCGPVVFTRGTRQSGIPEELPGELLALFLPGGYDGRAK